MPAALAVRSLAVIGREARSGPSMARSLTPDVVAEICAHMNEDHADAVAHYARVFGKCERTVSARIRAFDACAMELEVVTSDGADRARIRFDHSLADADDARATLIAMARYVAPG